MSFDNIKENSVLIVEPNPYHGEILPGFVKYFRELGFSTDLLLRNENNVDDIFCRFENKPKVINGTAEELRNILKKDTISQYEYVFLSSSAFWEADFFIGSYINYLGFIPKAKNGIMMIEHHIEPYLQEYNEEEYLRNNRLFTLSGFRNTLMLNPHFFGENIKITPKSDKTVRFAAVGGNCKNYDLLLSAVSYLAERKYDFTVTIVGRGEITIPDNIKEYAEFKGYLNYEDMYSVVEKADYLLPLLDYSIQDHHRYIEGTTTGTRQLVMGFLKPCVIEDHFAPNYGFNERNSILYKNNNLVDGMIRAIELSNKDYKDLQKNLEKLEQQIYKISVENLKRALETNA